MKNSSGNDSKNKVFQHVASEKTMQLRQIDKIVHIIEVCVAFVLFVAFVGVMLAFFSIMLSDERIDLSRETINCFVNIGISIVIIGILTIVKREITREIKLDHTYTLTVNDEILVYKRQKRKDIEFRLPCYVEFILKGEEMPNGTIAMQDTIRLTEASIYLDLNDKNEKGKTLQEFLEEVGLENFL